MNREEAERAFEKGVKELRENKNYSKALKFISISNRLYPTAEKAQLIEECTLAQGQPHTHPSPTASTSTCNLSYHTDRICTILQDFILQMKGTYLRHERKYIAESYRQIIRTVVVLIIGVVILKFGFKQKISLGNLPGDVNYSSPGLQVFFPMTTCSLLSFVFPVVYKWYCSVAR